MNTIPLPPILAACVAALLLAACGAPPPPAAAPEPEPELEAEPEPEPPARPQIPLEERVRAPFAVIAEGRTAPREPRGAAVLSDLPNDEEPAEGNPGEGANDVDGGPAADEPAEDGEAAGGTPPEREAPAPPTAGAPATPAVPPVTATPPGGSGAPREYVVQVGDTFYGIARRFGVTPAALSAVNPGVDTERLRAGQELRLPAYATRPAAERPAAEPAADAVPRQPAATPEGGRHRVAAGETLWGIARRYGVSMERIREANRMADDTVRIGQTLVIPD